MPEIGEDQVTVADYTYTKSVVSMFRTDWTVDDRRMPGLLAKSSPSASSCSRRDPPLMRRGQWCTLLPMMD